MKKSVAFTKACKKFAVDPVNVPEIMSWEVACKYTGDDPKILPMVNHLPKHRQAPVIALYKLEIIAEAVNEKWRPDYTDHNKAKYFIWFDVKADKKRSSGFGLSYLDCDCWYSLAAVGVRLCFKNRDIARFIGNQFKDLYEDAYLFK